MVRKSNNNVLLVNIGLFQLQGMVYYRQCCVAGAMGSATFWSWRRSLNYWSGSGSVYVKS
jgi:hypothetical protein